MKKRKTTSAAYAKLCLPAILGALLCVSCVKEDLDGCDYSLEVSVMLQADPGEEAAAPAAGEIATIYIFDADGAFVDMEDIETPAFGREYTLKKRLPQGTYDFVAWVNHTEPYSINLGQAVSQAQKQTATLRLDIPAGKTVETELPALFHGKTDRREITRAGDQGVLEIPLCQNTNRIRLTVSGLLRTADTYRFAIADNNGVYDFDNNHVDCETFNYISRTQFEPGKDHLESALTVLRLGETRSPELTFENNTTGQRLYPSYEGQETDLVRLIRAAYDGRWIDFDRRHTFEVEIAFDPNLQATVSIDGWEVKEQGSEL